MEIDHLEDVDVDGRMIFKYIWKKWIEGRELDLCGSGCKYVAGSSENANESWVL
jgi:hypothetical protein